MRQNQGVNNGTKLHDSWTSQLLELFKDRTLQKCVSPVLDMFKQTLELAIGWREDLLPGSLELCKSLVEIRFGGEESQAVMESTTVRGPKRQASWLGESYYYPWRCICWRIPIAVVTGSLTKLGNKGCLVVCFLLTQWRWSVICSCLYGYLLSLPLWQEYTSHCGIKDLAGLTRSSHCIGLGDESSVTRCCWCKTLGFLCVFNIYQLIFLNFPFYFWESSGFFF